MLSAEAEMDDDFECAEGYWDDVEEHEFNELARDRECERDDDESDDDSEDGEGEDVIDAYSRAQAIEDGVLVELDQELAMQAGFRFHVAATRAVYDSCIALTPAAERACNDVTGRAWDVLFMAVNAIRRSGAGRSEVQFSVYVVRDQVRPTLTNLKVTLGPGDDAGPVFTIMFPEED